MTTAINNSSHDKLEKSVSAIDYNQLAEDRGRKYFASPLNWEDEILYFLMLDRFSDGNEKSYRDINNQPVTTGHTPLFDIAADSHNADRASWYASGGRWCHGTIKGLQSKLGYLSRLGVTALWISPVFKQVDKIRDECSGTVTDSNSYHGYGVQNFLDVDPHFGTRQDLCDLVAQAHSLNIRVILDIILNHSGDVFAYTADRYPVSDQNGNPIYCADGSRLMDPRWDGRTYQVKGYRAPDGTPSLHFGQNLPETAWPDGAIWPAELQRQDTFSKLGRISNWDYDPEFLDGDFCSLKDIDHGFHGVRDEKKVIDDFYPSPALSNLCEVYKFWIAYADIDGYRIDTVKHMEIGATRYFVSSIHEFAESLGKENFLLAGEITGGRQRAFTTLQLTGLDVALGIDDVQDKLEFLAKGYRNPEDYFNLFRNSELIGKESHTWFCKHIITMYDDHDHVRGAKTRFCGHKGMKWQDKSFSGYDFLIPIFGLHLCSMGIPCIYYGTEQGFDGAPKKNDPSDGQDRLLRECMFGGNFGSFQSADRHFFNESNEAFRVLSEIIALRKSRIELRRGRQYLRQISGTGTEGQFGYPVMIGGQIRSIVAWSRLFANSEVLCAINTDPVNTLTVCVTIDASLHRNSAPALARLYATDISVAPASAPIVDVNGKAVYLTVPPCGFVAYA